MKIIVWLNHIKNWSHRILSLVLWAESVGKLDIDLL